MYFLVTNPLHSGPPPRRPPPPIVARADSVPEVPLSRLYSLRSTASTLSRQQAGDDEVDDLEDTEEEPFEVSRRQLNDASDLVLSLPPFATGSYSCKIVPAMVDCGLSVKNPVLTSSDG